MAPRRGHGQGLRTFVPGFVAVSAYYGVLGLIVGFVPTGPTVAARLPFQSPVFAGLALALVVAGPSTAACVLALRRRPRAREAIALAGGLLVAWIVVEVAIVRVFSPLQVVYAVLGLWLVQLGDRGILARAGSATLALPQLVTSRLVRRRRPRREATDAWPERTGPPWCVDLYWLPLGAGGRSVRWNGKAYEAFSAWRQHRQAGDLYHAALEVWSAGRLYVIEMAPVWNERSPERGVVREGPVGSRRLGRLRAFRYEIRCWLDGHIPDVDEAVDSPQRLSQDEARATTVLSLVREAPALTWGRDELGSGDMWNSNSLVSWLLASTGHDTTEIAPPAGGRAPGWAAGLHLAARREVEVRTAVSPGHRR